MAGLTDVFDIAFGKVSYYAMLPGATDSIIAVALTDAGLEADSALRQHATLDVLLAAGNTESAAASYARVTLTTVTSTPDTTNHKSDADADNIDFGTIEAGETWSKVLICYVPSSGAADSAIIPLTYHALADIDTNGGNITANVANFFRAQ